MSDRDGNFEIVIHLSNGNHARLGRIADDHARVLVRELNPVSFFTQRQLFVAGSHSMSYYRPAAITYMEILMDGYPEWRWPTEFAEITQLTADQFRERYTAHEADAKRDAQDAIGKPFAQLALIELVDGKVLYIEATMIATSRIDKRMMSQQLGGMAALHARHHEGGVLLINLTHAVRITFFPGTDAPANAWIAHQLPVREKAEARPGKA